MAVPQTQLESPQYSFGPSSLLFLCLLSLILSCEAIRLDINVYDYSGVKRKVKLICERFEGNPRSENGEKLQEPTNQSAHINIPDILANSSQYFKCFFLEPIIIADHKQLKKRLARELSDSADAVPVKNGICSSGYRIKGDKCFPCLPGSYTSGQQSECILCPKNFFIDFKAAPSCWPCPEGKITVGEGAGSSDLCIPPRKNLGTPASDSTSKYIIIVSILLVVILLGWFIILYWFLFYRNRHHKKPEPTYKDLGIIERGTAKRRGTAEDEALYSDFDSDEEEDHVYEQVSPAHSDEHIYEDIDKYQKPPARHPHPNTKHKNSRNIKQSSGGYYNQPATKNTRDNKDAIKKPTPQKPPEYSDYSYEVPISKSKGENAPYSTVNKPKPEKPTYSNDTYEEPISKNQDGNAPYSNVDKPSPAKLAYSADTYEEPISKNTDNVVMRVQVVSENPFKEHIDGPSFKMKSKYRLPKNPLNDLQTSRVRKSAEETTDEQKQTSRPQNKSRKPHKPQEHLGGDGPSIEILPELAKARPSKSSNRVFKIPEQDPPEVSNHGVQQKNVSRPKSPGLVDQDRSQPSKRFAKKEMERGKNRQSSHKKDSDINLGAKRLSLLNENISKILEEDPIKAIRASRSEGVLKKHRPKETELPTRKFRSEMKSNTLQNTERSNTKNFRMEV